MSTSVSTSFVRQYERDAQSVFQRKGGILRQCCRTKDNVIGSSTTFQKIGRGVATTKARHGAITPMNQDHTAVECTLSDFYAGDWVDKLDEAKLSIDERMAIAEGGAWALGRKVDDQILTALDGTSQTSVSGTVSSAAAIRNYLLGMEEALNALDVPNDGQRYGVMTSHMWALAETVVQFTSQDYVGANGMPLIDGGPIGRFKRYASILWTVHTAVPGVTTNSGKIFAWHKNAIAYATGNVTNNVAASTGGGGFTAPIAADITWHGDRAAFFVNHWMSGGAVLVDDTGVIEGNHDDNDALPTS